MWVSKILHVNMNKTNFGKIVIIADLSLNPVGNQAKK